MQQNTFSSMGIDEFLSKRSHGKGRIGNQKYMPVRARLECQCARLLDFGGSPINGELVWDCEAVETGT
jgi:hypothetical protein